jgi:hypothetical protein
VVNAVGKGAVIAMLGAGDFPGEVKPTSNSAITNESFHEQIQETGLHLRQR